MDAKAQLIIDSYEAARTAIAAHQKFMNADEVAAFAQLLTMFNTILCGNLVAIQNPQAAFAAQDSFVEIVRGLISATERRMKEAKNLGDMVNHE